MYIPNSILSRDVIRHGGFKNEDPYATVLHVTGIRSVRVPYMDMPEDTRLSFEAEVGFYHTAETYIRSYLMLFESIFNDENVNEITAAQHPRGYCKAIAQHLYETEHDYSYEYHHLVDHQCRVESTNTYYEFDLPTDWYCVIPMELGAWYYAIDDANKQRVLGQLAHEVIYATIPISNIRIVSD